MESRSYIVLIVSLIFNVILHYYFFGLPSTDTKIINKTDEINIEIAAENDSDETPSDFIELPSTAIQIMNETDETNIKIAVKNDSIETQLAIIDLSDDVCTHSNKANEKEVIEDIVVVKINLAQNRSYHRAIQKKNGDITKFYITIIANRPNENDNEENKRALRNFQMLISIATFSFGLLMMIRMSLSRKNHYYQQMERLNSFQIEFIEIRRNPNADTS